MVLAVQVDVVVVVVVVVVMMMNEAWVYIACIYGFYREFGVLPSVHATDGQVQVLGWMGLDKCLGYEAARYMYILPGSDSTTYLPSQFSFIT